MVRELDQGGCERDAAKIAVGLDRSRFEPHVGVFRAGGFRTREIEAAGVPILSLDLKSFLDPSVLRGARKLGAYIRQHGIQLIHAFDVPLDIFAAPVARWYRVPAVITSQLSYRDLCLRRERLALRLSDRLCDRIVVNSRAVGDYLERQIGVPGEKIYLSHNGVYAKDFHPGPAIPAKAAGAPLVIGAVCAMRREKRIDWVIRSFAEVRASHPNLRLLLVGSGAEVPGLMALRDQLGLEDVCDFEPGRAAVAEAMQSIDIYINSSSSESFPNGLLEAMACGCCVIGSSVGGIPELVTHREDGLIFDSADAGQLTAMLRLAASDDSLRQKLRRQAVITAHERFSMRNALQRTESLYRMLLERDGPPCAPMGGVSSMPGSETQGSETQGSETNKDDLPFRHYTLKHRVIARISSTLFDGFKYTVHHGLLKGMKRKGGLGWMPEALSGSAETAEHTFWRSLDLKDLAIYDVGAFQGLLTMFFARQARQVVCFEPSRRNRERLQQNVTLNRLTNVIVRDVGLGSKPGTLELVSWDLMPGGSSGDSNVAQSLKESNVATRSEAVRISTIDDEIRESKLPKPDFIKVDIEGMEIDALRGGAQTIREHRPALFLEMHGETMNLKRAKAAEIVAYLLSLGYATIVHVETGTLVNDTNAAVAAEGHLYAYQGRDLRQSRV
ncbi:MAG TPA: FkbM family methyltransferase [Bryobacteraceae bacterium]